MPVWISQQIASCPVNYKPVGGNIQHARWRAGNNIIIIQQLDPRTAYTTQGGNARRGTRETIQPHLRRPFIALRFFKAKAEAFIKSG